ncbi:MAG: HEAT repeat domain-containing protein [Botrimarina sp.]
MLVAALPGSALPAPTFCRDTPAVFRPGFMPLIASPAARALALGLGLASLLLLAAVRLAVWRLDVAAGRHAAEGGAIAAVGLAADWVEAIVPVALSADGAAGQRARAAATARVNAIAARLDHADDRRTATRLLAAFAEARGPITPAGADWATWASRRLVEQAGLCPVADRFALYASVERATAALRVRPKRLAVAGDPRDADEVAAAPPARPTPEPEAATDQVTPSEQPPVQAAARRPADAPPPPAEPTLVVRVAPPEPAAAVPSPATARLDWRRSAAEPEAEPAAPVTELSDRELLVACFRAYVEAGAAGAGGGESLTARGPASADPSEEATDPATRQASARLLALQAEVLSRGYTSVAADQLEPLASGDAARRVALAEELLVSRSPDAAKLLIVLAKDPSAEVRRSAISALGSASSEELVRIAWRLATDDVDPRVGRLAEAFRARLQR